jgi:hypothetical protein
VNVPFADQWALAPVFDRIAMLRLRPEDLLGFQDEHRLLFPMLVWAPLAFLSGWDVRLEVLLNLAAGVATFVALGRLFGLPRDAAAQAVRFCVAVLVFSIAAWENWVLGIQISWWLVELPLVLALVRLSDERVPVARRLAFAAVAAVVASFSEAQGLLLWGALLPAVAVAAWRDAGRRFALAAWVLAAAACGAVYAIGFDASRAEAGLADPIGRAAFALTLLGAPLVHFLSYGGALALAPVVGLAALATFGVVVAPRLRRLDSADAAFVGLGLYALGFSGLVALGRGAEGTPPAFAPRYIGHAVLLYVAVLGLLDRQAVSPRARRGLAWASATILLAHAASGAAGLVTANAFRDDLRLGRGCFELIRQFDPRALDVADSCLVPLRVEHRRPGARRLRAHALTLSGLGFRRFPLALPFADDEGGHLRGHLDVPQGTVLPSDGIGALHFAGWAVPEDEPTLVVFRRAGEETLLAAALASQPSPDVRAVHGRRFASVRFVASVPSSLLPDGPSTLQAYAWDRQGGVLYPLQGEAQVEVSRQKPPAPTGR